MKGTRLQTMASVLVTLVTPAAFAVVSHPSEEKAVKKQQTQESFSTWQIPAPGQTLGRVPSAASSRESFGALGTIETVDPVNQSPKARFGRLPMNLVNSFGGQVAFERWVKAAQKSSANRTAFAQHVEKSIRSFAVRHQNELSLAGLRLNWDSKRFYVDGQHVFASFFVTAADTIIEGAELTLRFTDGQLTNIVTKTFAASQAGLSSFALSNERAQEAARAVLGPSASVEASTVSKRFVARSEGGRYIFEPSLRLEAKSATGETFTVVAHAERNEILSWNANTIFFEAHINGIVNQRAVRGAQATVGMPYVQAQARTGGWFGRSTTFDANSSGVIQVPDRQKARVTLASTRFRVDNNGGTPASAPINGDVLFDGRSNSTLAENTTYYHLNVAQAWARPVVNPKWFSTQVVANVNINDVCNAYWNGRTLNFFQSGSKNLQSGKSVSCSNTGEIADVVYHEWGHGLHDNTGGIRDRAFSEGIGDTVAQLITGSAEVGPGFFADGRPVRNLDSNYMYPPKDNEREVHREGLIFGSTYFHLTQDLVAKYGKEVGRATARQWFLKMLYTAAQYTDAYEAILALDSEPSVEDVRGANFCLINNAFARHGLAVKDVSCK
ncbi:hypothetical protein EBU99_03895 [bacterium]|nr:hypothetical protein [bacterium]